MKANYFVVLCFTIFEKIYFLPYCVIIWTAVSLARLRMKLILRFKCGRQMVLAERNFTHDVNSLLGRSPQESGSKIAIAINTWIYPVDIDKTRKIWKYEFQNHNKCLRRLTRILTKYNGYYVWKKDENFDINSHIKVYEGERILTETDLLEYCETLLVEMDVDKPQWELILVPNVLLREGFETVQISRFHQGYKKNLSFVLRRTSILNDNPTSFSFSIDPNTLQLPISTKVYFYFSTLFLPLYKHLHDGRAEKIWILDKSSLDKNATSASKFLGWSDPLDFNKLKLLKSKTNLSISTLVSVIIGFSLKNVFEKEYPLPQYFRFGTLKRNLGRNALSCNTEFLIKDLIFPVFRGSHSINRKGMLQLISLNKSNLRSPTFLYPDKLVSLLPSLLSDSAENEKPINTHTAFIYNFPVTSKKLNVFGEQIEQIMAFAPLQKSSGLSFACVTYSNVLRICCTANSSWINRYQLKLLMSNINIEFQYLAKEVLGEKQKIKFNTNSLGHTGSNIYRHGLVFP